MSKPERPIVIGVDAGGSKTAAWVVDSSAIQADRNCTPIGSGRSGPGNIRAVGFSAATDAIDQAITRALDDAGLLPTTESDRSSIKLCIAAAGAGRSSEQLQLTEWAINHFGTSAVRVTADAMPILAAATPQQIGIALIAGTGSLAWGRDAQGTTDRCGGWGYLFGDEGGGFAIAIHGLRAATHYADGRGRPTSLLDRFCDHLQIESAAQLVEKIYVDPISRDQIARLSEIVFAAAPSDQVARQIVDDAADELASLVTTLANKLDFADRLPVLALGGGLLVHQTALAQAVIERIGHAIAEVHPVADPVAGAALLAAEL